MTQKNINDSNLQNVLAELYQDKLSAQNVAERAGLNPGQIALDSNAKNNWYEIIKEANKQERLNHLIGVALNDYGRHAGLIRAAIRILSSSENLASTNFPSPQSYANQIYSTSENHRSSLHRYPNPVIDILYLTTNPSNNSIIKAAYGSYSMETSNLIPKDQMFTFDIRNHLVETADDLVRLLHLHQPFIVHFSSSGFHSIGTNRNNPQTISDRRLELIFSHTLVKDFVRFVILDGCYSRSQADVILRYVDCVIGIPDGIPQDTTNEIYQTFYTHITHRYSLKDIRDAIQDTVARSDVEVRFAPRKGNNIIIDEIYEQAGYGFAYLELNQEGEVISNHSIERLLAYMCEQLGLSDKTVVFCGLKMGDLQTGGQQL